MAAGLATAFTSLLPAGMSLISHAAPILAHPPDYVFSYRPKRGSSSWGDIDLPQQTQVI